MSARLKRNALCLCLLAETDPALARAIIEKVNGDLVRSLRECSHNIIKAMDYAKKMALDDIVCWIAFHRSHYRPILLEIL